MTALTLIDENSIDVLEKFDNAVILFMGAGDIQKLLKAYFEKLGVKMIFNMFHKASGIKTQYQLQESSLR